MCFIVVDPPNAIVAVVVDFWFSRTMHPLDFKTWIQFATICFCWPWLQFKNSGRTILERFSNSHGEYVLFVQHNKPSSVESDIIYFISDRDFFRSFLILHEPLPKLISFLMRNCMSATINLLVSLATKNPDIVQIQSGLYYDKECVHVRCFMAIDQDMVCFKQCKNDPNVTVHWEDRAV